MISTPSASKTASQYGKYLVSRSRMRTHRLQPSVQGHREVAGLLSGHADDMQAATSMLDEHQDVDTPSDDRIRVQKIAGDDPLGLRAEELPPRRAGAARRRVKVSGVKNLPDGGCRDLVAEFRQLTLGVGGATMWGFPWPVAVPAT
jgi:hypothetical protein